MNLHIMKINQGLKLCLLFTFAVASLAPALSQAQQWVRGGDTLSGYWSLDVDSVKKVGAESIQAWYQITSNRDLPSPNGMPVRHIRGLWRISCNEVWYEQLAEDVRTESGIQVSSKTYPPAQQSRTYAPPGTSLHEMLTAACTIAAKR
jgi:hypothetical protein